MPSTISVVITGAAGRIAYALLPLVCSGDVFGKDVQIDLRLLDIEMSAEKLRGVALEIEDCCYHNLKSLVATVDPQVAFADVNVAVLLGGFPRMAGMERKDLTMRNAKGMRTQGMALEKYASRDVKVLVVANPANTNALVAQRFAPSIPRENFTCLTRLDNERLSFFVAQYINESRQANGIESGHPPTRPADVQDSSILGNHSSTQVPYVDIASVRIGSKILSVTELLEQHPRNTGKKGSVLSELIARVQQRGAEILKAQGASSGFSAADSIAKHLRDWLGEDNNSSVFSMGVDSAGNPYGVPDGLIFSFPCRKIQPGKVEIVKGLKFSSQTQHLIDLTVAELCGERADAESAVLESDRPLSTGLDSKL